MAHRNLRECLADLERVGQLRRIDVEVDAELLVGAIQRRVFQVNGPALLFTKVKDCDFPMASNIFGTLERVHFLFRDTLPIIEQLLKLKVDPLEGFKHPLQSARLFPALLHIWPRRVRFGPVLECVTTISRLPKLKSWPNDGGTYVTLPQVYTEDPACPGFRYSNLGMYRIQLDGNCYLPNQEVGLHYQIHRGIGSHHAEAISRGEPLRVNIFIGGPPALTIAAIMPLPEGVPELFFAGILAGHRIRMIEQAGLPMSAEADFCITGRIDSQCLLPEGPFGDHLGYYSLVHDFPVLRVEKVFHRKGAIWPFTTVGRPPQEDTIYGTFIHELTKDLIPNVFSGIHEVNAVDVAGVHPLLLAVGSERYVPYIVDRQPQELLTCAMNLLGNTQTALSKYVLIAAREDDRHLTTKDIPAFFRHILERVDLARDLHFITRTTMDTLDYSGISLNQGSKLVCAAAGRPRRKLTVSIPTNLYLPFGFSQAKVQSPGILVLAGPLHNLKRDTQDPRMEDLCRSLEDISGLDGLPLIVVTDDATSTAVNWDNFLWVTFTRSDPATDLYGVRAFIHCKHWGCHGPLVIDARLKKYHAPPLTIDPKIERLVDALGAPGRPLHGII